MLLEMSKFERLLNVLMLLRHPYLIVQVNRAQKVYVICTDLIFTWFSIGNTTEIPSMAKIAVPKKSGRRSEEAIQGTECELGRSVEKM